jgi:hypothetical protein
MEGRVFTQDLSSRFSFLMRVKITKEYTKILQGNGSFHVHKMQPYDRDTNSSGPFLSLTIGQILSEPWVLLVTIFYRLHFAFLSVLYFFILLFPFMFFFLSNRSVMFSLP